MSGNAEGPGSLDGRGPLDGRRRPGRGPAAWRVGRRFRHAARPASRSWPDVYADLDGVARGLGRWHPATLSARLSVFRWLFGEGLHADIVRLSEAEVADRTAEFGAEDPETLRWRSALAWHRRRVGDLDGAVAEARAVEETTVRLLGSDHADAHRRRADLARFLAESGECAEGVRLLRALYAESLAFDWRRQRETRSIRNSLIVALELAGDVQEALDLLDEEITAERGTIYGVDENLGDHEMQRLQEWRRNLVAKAAAG
ncbi:hypothetical protein [Streptomyces sp. NPDC050504]|uniref:hypothetical protein n=1 Tax=Streptomyces sp. NPDC050504 TaxID=3365618 RepID=UPI00378AE095